MLRAVHGNRAEVLLGALIDALPPIDPFTSTTIVVGKHLVARWLKREIALVRGIAAGLDIINFDRFVERAWAGDEAAQRAGVFSLDRARLAAALASALADERVVMRMPAVASYLAAAPAPGDRAGPRRVQLAQHLAQLAWAYAQTRPDWLPVLLAGNVPAELEGDPAAPWQAGLLAAAVRRLGDGLWAPTPCVPWARRRAGLPPPTLAPIAVFGIGSLTRAQLETLTDLGTTTDVTVYVLDPCRELWDDVSSRAKAAGATAAAPDPLLLALWGKPVRDTLGALVERTGGDLEDRFAEPARATVLGELLGDVLERRAAPAGPVEPAKPDGVVVMACPNVRREIEVIADAVRARLDADPTLRAHEIGVWIAAGSGAVERYLAQAPAAFEAVGVPCHLVDAPIDDRGRIGEAVLALLELPTSGMRRRDLLRVMTHPALLAGYPHVDPADWVEWTEALGIAHGANAGAHDGTYLDEFPGQFHWDQGVRRLALGAFMTEERGAVRMAGVEIAPEEVLPEDQASAATYALLVRSLTADAAWLAGHTAPLAQWAAIFGGLVDAYLAPVSDDARRDLERVRAMLAGIARLDVDGRAVGFREASAHAAQRLTAERADRGEPLAAGVMIAPLRALRAIPFRVVYIAGLDEGVFPAGDQPSPLDLRRDARAGDVSPRDRDRHAFLEAILGAREALALSYVAVDATSGAPLGPSSVVLELADALAPYLGAASSRDALAAITERHALHRHADPGAAPRPAIARERWAAEVRDAVRAYLVAAGHPVPDEDGLLALLVHPAQAELRRALALVEAPPAAAPTGGPRPLSLANLRGFLEHPIQAWAQVVLGLHELPDDAAAQNSDEPFHVERPARATLLREVLAAWLREGGELELRYTATVHALELRGQFPVGVFGEAARSVDLALVRTWREQLGLVEAGAARRIGFGRAYSPGAELRPALQVDLGDGRSVLLLGQTELLLGSAARVMSVIPLLRDAEKSSPAHLRGALDHAVLAAAGLATAGHDHILLGGNGGVRRVAHAPWTADAAHAYLAGLVRELLDQPHGYLLPLDGLAKALAGKTMATQYGDQTGGLGFGPIQRRDGLGFPDDAPAIATRRLRPLVERMDGDHSFTIARSRS